MESENLCYQNLSIPNILSLSLEREKSSLEFFWWELPTPPPSVYKLLIYWPLFWAKLAQTIKIEGIISGRILSTEDDSFVWVVRLPEKFKTGSYNQWTLHSWRYILKISRLQRLTYKYYYYAVWGGTLVDFLDHAWDR